MNKNALTKREAGAMDFARDRVAEFRDRSIEIFGQNVLWLDKGENRRFARQMVKAYARQHPTQTMAIADYARAGWRLADEALREMIIEAVDRHETLPTYLAAYNMELARGGPRRLPGRERSDTFLRDMVITLIVGELVDRFGLPATGRNCSACSIVAEAMGGAGINVNYKAVEKVWIRWGRALRPCG